MLDKLSPEILAMIAKSVADDHHGYSYDPESFTNKVKSLNGMLGASASTAGAVNIYLRGLSKERLSSLERAAVKKHEVNPLSQEIYRICEDYITTRHKLVRDNLTDEIDEKMLTHLYNFFGNSMEVYEHEIHVKYDRSHIEMHDVYKLLDLRSEETELKTSIYSRNNPKRLSGLVRSPDQPFDDNIKTLESIHGKMQEILDKSENRSIKDRCHNSLGNISLVSVHQKKHELQARDAELAKENLRKNLTIFVEKMIDIASSQPELTKGQEKTKVRAFVVAARGIESVNTDDKEDLVKKFSNALQSSQPRLKENVYAQPGRFLQDLSLATF